jgi:hypothetical protein
VHALQVGAICDCVCIPFPWLFFEGSTTLRKFVLRDYAYALW